MVGAWRDAGPGQDRAHLVSTMTAGGQLDAGRPNFEGHIRVKVSGNSGNAP